VHVLLAKFVAYAAEHPDAEAVIVATTTKREHRYRTVTYAHLHAAINRYRDVLRRRGLRSGERVLLLVPPGEQFIAWSYAVMAADAVPVFLDPAMGAGNLRRCIALAEPQALVGVPLSHALRLLWRSAFRTVRLGVVARDGPLPSASSRQPASSSPAASTPEEAAIMFTSGGTGPPKGAIYLQETVRAQMEMLASLADVVPGSRDLPLLPAFALANAAAGACSVYLRPAAKSPLAFDADALIAVVNELRVRSSFGSPALWEKIASHCIRSGRSLPHIEKIFIAGAPVMPHQAALVRTVAPRAAVFMPYGCTEALPVTFPRSSDEDESKAATASGGERGTWIGNAVPGVDVAIVVCDDASPDGVGADGTGALLRSPPFEIGEIVVKGPNVSPGYAGSPEETRAGKIAADGGAWHRTGDIGYHDGCGDFYFLGRLQHVVRAAGKTFYPIAVERAFNRDSRVRRSALVQLREPDRSAVVVEPHPKHWPRSRRERERFAGELRALAAEDAIAGAVREVFFHRSLPVDSRHNAKIQRTQLSEWANRIER
jgi:acyl-CoA synthetase (AMP-forming)/AMP-acid ligase II